MLFDGLPIGSVPYLNAVPLTTGLETDLIALPPSKLAIEFHSGKLAAALLSITEALLNPNIDVLDHVAIACRGPVYSVFLAYREPLSEIREIAVDMDSCTSINLLKVWLSVRGLHPTLIPWAFGSARDTPPNLLLIGNPAIEFRRQNPKIPMVDLGAAWMEITGLPFVFAVWVMRRGCHGRSLRQALAAAQAAGLQRLDAWSMARTEFDAAFRRRYLGGYIRYRLGAEEKQGVECFANHLSATLGRRTFPLNFVGP